MRDHTRGLMLTVAGVLAISPDALLVRLVDAGPWAQLFWRGGLSGIVILAGALFVWRGSGVRDALRAMGWPGLAVTIIFSLGTAAFLYSVTHTLVANTLLIGATAPVFAALLSRVFLGEVIGMRSWITIAITLLGIAIIATGSGGTGGGSLDGDAAALFAALGMACVFVLARAHRHVSMVPAMGFAGLMSAVLALLVAPSVAIPADDWIWVGILGLVLVPLGFALLTTGPRYLPAHEVSLLMLLEALLGPLLVWLVLAENPGAHTLVGGAVVLAAITAHNMRRAAK